jgi:hypothetical protein
MSPQDAPIGRADVVAVVGGAVVVPVVVTGGLVAVVVDPAGFPVALAAGVVTGGVVVFVEDDFEADLVDAGVVAGLAVATEDAACACTARRETPAIAARATELRRVLNLRDMSCFLRSE